MAEKKDVWQGTLALMVLKTLDTLGPLHGYGIARRIEQTSGDLLAVKDQRRFAGGELRHAVSGTPEAGAGRLHPLRMGPLR